MGQIHESFCSSDPKVILSYFLIVSWEEWTSLNFFKIELSFSKLAELVLGCSYPVSFLFKNRQSCDLCSPVVPVFLII